MKTLLTLLSVILFVSASVKADDHKKDKKAKTQSGFSVPAAEFTWISTDDNVPFELALVKAKNALVPLAKPVLDQQNIDVPEALAFVKAKNASVPVAPFAWGDAQESELSAEQMALMAK